MAKRKYRSIDAPWEEDEVPKEKTPSWVGPPYRIEETEYRYSPPRCQKCGFVYCYGEYRHSQKCYCEKKEYWRNVGWFLVVGGAFAAGFCLALLLGLRL